MKPGISTTRFNRAGSTASVVLPDAAPLASLPVPACSMMLGSWRRGFVRGSRTGGVEGPRPAGLPVSIEEPRKARLYSAARITAH